MKTRVSHSVGFLALISLLTAGPLAFPSSARAQTAQVNPQAAAQTQRLRGHVPAALSHLEPLGRLPANNRLKLAVGLPLRDPEGLARFLAQLHDPAHPNFRHYLTPDEFAARFGPSEADYQAVIAFAKGHGLVVHRTHPNRTLLDVTGSVSDVEQALHVTLRLYPHPTEDRTFYAPEVEPSLDLAVRVLSVSGLDNYALPRPRLQATPLESRAGVSPAPGSKAGPGSGTGAGETPALQPNSGSGPSGTYRGYDFRAAYVPGTALTGAGQVVGLLQFDGYAASDIAYYENQAGLPSVPLTNVLLDGFSGNPTGSGGEVEVCLDIETAISMAPGLAGVVVYMAGPSGNFHDILNRMATDNLAKQLSCSWYQPGAGADAVADQIFQQMAAQGQSFFNASGDYDAFTGPVDFPGETPYIVQVGGTTLTTSGPGGAWVSEKVWNWNNGIGTGGGISTRYAIPSYQADISMAQNQGSTTMRNIPDVALTADNVYVRANGRDYNVGGTSCAAPLWAGFNALVNQQAVSSGRPVVGFINPAVDAIGHAANYTACFHDIATGDNTSSGSPSKFYAVAGYDLCTGWGAPAGQGLIDALATPDPLLTSPAALAFSGAVGGPFSPNPAFLTLTNSGTNAVSWTLVNTSAWFNVSPTSGTVLPGEPAASVSVSVAASANTLPAGVYPAAVWITNLNSGVARSCSLALSVAVPGMADAFDPGIDLAQWSSFGGAAGSTVLATNYGGSVSAPNSLWFGAKDSRFATTVPINTSGGGQLGFCLSLANGTAWPWAQPDSLPAEGVLLECSTNGGWNWATIGNYDNAAYCTWTGVAMPIPAVARGPAVLFRWRQPSNSGTNYDHWALDNVVISTGSMAPRIVMDPQSQNDAAGDAASLSVAAVGTPPLSYQWLLNGTNISGATASSLAWANVQLTNAGTYSVLVSNSLGTALSSNAVVTVYVPVCAPPPDGLVAWWQAEGDASDSVGGNDGTLMNGTGFAPGRVNQAFSFDGVQNYVANALPGLTGIRGAYTMEFWALPKASRASTAETATGTAGVSKQRYAIFPNPGSGGIAGAGVSVGTNGVSVFECAAYYMPSVLVYNTSLTRWTHIAVVYSNRQARLYLNGVLVRTGVTSNVDTYPSTCLGEMGIGYGYYAGLLDEVSIYNRALSASEIQAIYNASSAGKCTTPTAPFITAQPVTQTVAVGETATFAVGASGTRPLSYQWLLNGTNINGATASSLTWANAQLTDAGTYSVLVSNSLGTAVSSNAILAVYVPVCAPPPDGMVGWWQGEGDASDSIGGNNGTLMNGSGFAPGEAGQAFSFDGVRNYVANPVPGLTNVRGAYTMEFWALPKAARASTSESASGTVGVSNQRYAIFPNPGSGGIAGAGVSVGTNGVSVFECAAYYMPSVLVYNTPITAWTHIAVVYSNRQARLYLNGALVRTGVTSNVDTYPSTCLGEMGIGYGYYAGLLDEVSIYNRALSATEIQAIYGARSAGKCMTPTAPFITSQPVNQTVPVGGTASLTVGASGTRPLSYQWRLNGTNINGATTSSLTWANAQLTDAGTYSVLVSNALGTVTSSNAVLAVYVQLCAPPPDGMVGWWQGEGSADDSISGNNGTLMNGTGFAPGKVGQAFNFDGVQNYVANAVPGLTNVRGAYTMEFWAWPKASRASTSEATSGLAGISNQRYAIFPNPGSGGIAGAGVSVGNNGVSFFECADVYMPSLLVYDTPITGWTHIAVVYLNQQARLYLNGVLVRTGLTSNVPTYPSTCLGEMGIGYGYYAGLLDEVSIYNRALSAAEIQAIFLAGSAGKCTTPTAPFITSQPASQAAIVGGMAIFTATASGTPPLSYQWQFNGTNIAGATSTALTLTNISFTQAGNYEMWVTNPYGSTNTTIALLTVNPPPPCAAPPAGLVGWWQGEGNATDIAGGNNGTLMNGVGFGPGEVGQAFNFDGVQSYIANAVPGLTNVRGDYTMEFWAWPKAARASTAETASGTAGVSNQRYAIFPNPGSGGIAGAGVSVGNNGVSVFECAAYYMPSVLVYNTPITGWTHVAVVYSNRQARLYLNGVLVRTGVSSGVDTYPSTCLGEMGIGYGYYAGLLDEVSIYNRALSASEIQAIYNAGSEGKCTTPTPPSITSQPTNQTVTVQDTAIFTVVASGTAPLNYQWQFNGTNIAGGTNTSLTLTNVGCAQAGAYAVWVTNAYGWTNSASALLTVLPPPPCVSPLPGLVGWWQGEGNANDSVGGHNGTLMNGAGFAPGKVLQAFSFDGVSSYVANAMPGLTNVRSAYTMEFWAWPKAARASTGEGTSGFAGISNQRYAIFPNPGSGGIAGAGVSVGNNGVSVFECMASYMPSVLVYNTPITAWTHIAVVYTNRQARLYLNGALVHTGITSNVETYPSTCLGEMGIGYGYYAGLLDEVSIYNRALSAAEIQGIYHAGGAGKCGLAAAVQTPPQSCTNECASTASFSVTATGLPSLAYQWYFGANLIPGATNTWLTLTNVGFAQAGNYSVVVTNAYGSASGGPAVLTIVDTIPPAILACAANRTLSAGVNCTATMPDLTGEVAATDASGAVVVTQNPAPGTQLGLGTTNVIFTARDSSGNASTCAGSVTVADTTPPFIMACVLEVNVDLGTNCQAWLPDLTGTRYIVASDNCSAVSVAQQPPAGTVLFAGTNTVWLTVSDSASNQTSRAVSVLVQDRTPPVLACPANRQVAYGVAWSFDSPTATDNCSAAIITIVGTVTNVLSGSTYAATRTWQAVDVKDNKATGSQTVTVVGSTLPTISVIANQNMTTNSPPRLIHFTISEANTAASNLTVSASSTNTALWPTNSIVFGGSDTNRTVTLTPAAGQMGEADITLTVSDGYVSTNTTFHVSVADQMAWTLWWESAGGYLACWAMKDTNLVEGAYLNPCQVDPSWKIVGTGDFNGDGKTDILWRHSSGLIACWFMNGLNVLEGVYLNPRQVDPSWTIVGTGDFNGDGQTDILWQHSSGLIACWFMKGINVIEGVYFNPSQVDPSWKIVGTGDFNGDGKTDILWRHSSGLIACWFMNGLNVLEGVYLNPSQVDPSWKIVGARDVNGDGQTDLLWQHASGLLACWFMQGTNVVEGVYLNPATVGPSWKVVGHK